MWKALFLVLAIALLSGCATDGARDGAAGGREALEADLFPFVDREVRFVTNGGEARDMRVESGADGASANLWIRGEEGSEVRMDIRRQGEAIHFSRGPELGPDLLRLGESPGARWRFGRMTVNFDGWDRIETPAGTFDAARITTYRGEESFQQRETWWFARGEGLVRLRMYNAGLWDDEMWRTQ